MEKAALSLAVAAVSPIISKLSGAAASYFGGDVTSDELDQMRTIILPKISTVIQQAEKIDAEKLRPWLMSLQSAAYEAEDILDMYEYNTIKRQVSPLPTSLVKMKDKAKELFAPVLLKTKMKTSLEKLKRSADDADQLIPLLSLVHSTAQDDNTTGQQQRTTVSAPSSPVFGRLDELNALVNMLTDETLDSSSQGNVILHAIHGIGGAGKTTLAHSVFNHPIVQSHFGLTIWVHVSRTFDAHKITKDIIEGAGAAYPAGDNLDVLQRKLKEALMPARFLLVLDDVWTEDMQSWDQLLVPLHQGGKVGSRILITTRMERTVLVSRVVARNIVSLGELPVGQCRLIFKYYAFDDAYKVIEDPELADICEEALFKLKNSPLAARLAGSLFRKNACTVSAWRRILRTDMLGDTMDVILLSFQHLPPHLQCCFAICSLYKKGYRYDSTAIDALVRLWIAHGYVEATGSESLEDKGRRCFDDLSSYSLFQKDPTGRCVMHDLVHDLAERISGNFCFRIEGNDPVCIPPTVIHLSVFSSGELDMHIANILQMVNLRTLISASPVGVIFNKSSKQEVAMVEKLCVPIFEKLTKLRVLRYVWFAMPTLSGSVRKLKHLRDLQLLDTMDFPESLGTLYHLQYLHVDYSTRPGFVSKNFSFGRVPKSLNNLVKLRHVSPFICSRIDDVGRLTYLQEMSFYTADKTKQYGLQQLEKLQQIRGKLEIAGLEFVKDKAGATFAMLKGKGHLDKLVLRWGDSRAADEGTVMGEDVLEGLEPHPNLKILNIQGYMGANLPSWIGVVNSRQWLLRNLTSLALWRCPNLTVVPNLPCRLRELSIVNCTKLMQIRPLPCSLEVMEMTNCPGTEAFLSSAGASYKGSSSHQPFTFRSLWIGGECDLEENTLNEFLMNIKFHSHSALYLGNLPDVTSLLMGPHLIALENLYIVGLGNLRSINGIGFLASLKTLEVEKCPDLARTTRAVGGGISNDNRLLYFKGTLVIDELLLLPVLLHERGLNSLVELSISKCSQNVPFSDEQEGIFLQLSSLARLSSRECDDLPSLPRTLEKLYSIIKLIISNCQKIESLPQLPWSLKSLKMTDCAEVESLHNLPASLESLHIGKLSKIVSLPNLPRSLKFLLLDTCPKIESLPTMPASLETLHIEGCHPRLEENYEVGGPLRHEINHIPRIIGPWSV